MLDRDFKPHEQDKSKMRRKIFVRLALAVALIAVLLATLLIFEQQKIENETAPSPSGTQIEIGVAMSSSSEVISDDVQRAINEAPDVTQAALATMSAPEEVLTAPSMPVSIPDLVRAPVVPEGSRDVSIATAPITPISPIKRLDPRTGKLTHSDRVVIEASKPAQLVAASKVVSSPAAAPVAAVNSGFVLQLGVFNSVTNAEELREKLKLAGIPSQLETRVQVGPFTNKEDAVKAQEKLRALGLGGGMLVQPRKP
jgi:DedD protein